MFHRLKIAPRLALLILLGTGVVVAAMTLYDYVQGRRLLEEELRAKARHIAFATAREMELIKRAVEKVVQEVAVVLATEPFPTERVYELLENTLRAHDEIFGSAVALVAPSQPPQPVAVPYVHRGERALVRKDLAAAGYPVESSDWFVLPRELGAPVWSEPYFDEGGGDLIMVTYAVPLFVGAERRFRGVVTGDLSLDWLESLRASIEIGEGGYAFVLSRNGTVVSHPRRDLIMRESIFSIAEERGSEALRQVGRRMTRGETGFVEFVGFDDPELYWLAYTPVAATGWSIGLLFPRKVIAENLLALSHMKIVLGGLGALAMIAVALAIARSISRPIRELDAAARVLAGGNLSAPLPVARGTDEIAHLTLSFSRMRQSITEYIEELRKTTAAKARIEADLETARTIQLDLVPSRFTFDPPRPAIDIYALLEPARAVGGDFYDFFWCGSDTFFIAVGDVSGKGVPAALFMALSKAYLRAFASRGNGPAEALALLNDELAAENDEGMFLTAFCCCVELATGNCTYANGGHPPPLILRRSGGVDVVPSVKGPLIGMDKGRSFEAGSFALEPGDLLLAVSDGVTEAEDAVQAQYGDDRLARKLAGLAGQSARDALESVRKDVRAFTGQAPASDDITLLAIRYVGGAPLASSPAPP